MLWRSAALALSRGACTIAHSAHNIAEMKHLRTSILAILLSLGLAGCDETRKTPPNVAVAFVNAAPSYSSVSVLREETTAADLNYLESAGGSFGADTYDFHLEVGPIDDERQRLVSFALELVAGMEYTIVATEVNGDLQERIFETTGGAGGAGVLHLAPMLAAVDFYVVTPGTDPAAATPLGTVSLGQQLEPASITAGEVEIVLTEASNPAAELLRSPTLPLPTDASLVFTIVEGAGLGFADIAVVISGATNFAFVDRDVQSSIRVINAISNRSTLDFGIDGDLDPPLLPSVAFGSVTDYTLIDAGTPNITGTPEGNPSVLEVDLPFDAEAGRFATIFIAGNPGDTSGSVSNDDLRPITGEAKISLFNGAGLFQFVDFFLLSPGTDISQEQSTSTLQSRAASSNISVVPGEYELTLRDSISTTILADPITFTLDEGGFYSVLITDSTGGSTVDITLFDDFN